MFYKKWKVNFLDFNIVKLKIITLFQQTKMEKNVNVVKHLTIFRRIVIIIIIKRKKEINLKGSIIKIIKQKKMNLFQIEDLEKLKITFIKKIIIT